MNPVRIERLSKNNFDTWKIQMEALLIKNKLMRVRKRKDRQTPARSEWRDIGRRGHGLDETRRQGKIGYNPLHKSDGIEAD